MIAAVEKGQRVFFLIISEILCGGTSDMYMETSVGVVGRTSENSLYPNSPLSMMSRSDIG